MKLYRREDYLQKIREFYHDTDIINRAHLSKHLSKSTKKAAYTVFFVSF